MKQQDLVGSSNPGLTPVLITLLKGVLYRDQEPMLWSALLNLRSQASDYVGQVGLDQFGLEWVEDLSRSFRFVVIDEAFGRGSDESAEFGLKLFGKLNLQLMIVTPLQKTHVIEPHVASVAFVENRSGKSSTVLNLSIEEHRRQKAARLS